MCRACYLHALAFGSSLFCGAEARLLRMVNQIQSFGNLFYNFRRASYMIAAAGSVIL